MLICVCERRSKLSQTELGFICSWQKCPHSTPAGRFHIIEGIPILISEQVTDTVCSLTEIDSYVPRSREGLRSLAELIGHTAQVTRANCSRFVAEVGKRTQQPLVLVIGSGTQGKGTEMLRDSIHVQKVGIDIYPSDTVDVVCDAHYLPFANESFDGVWIQDVLEHVVEPRKVVKEIVRVLKPGGVVYAETPFLLAVHENGHDFTRFTVLGHRYLFNRFDAIDFGGARGSDVSLAWATRYFIQALFRSKQMGRVFGIMALFVLRPVRGLLSKRAFFDSPAEVYFLGTKNEGAKLSHRDLVSLYRGFGSNLRD